jgi:hypothetical protein
LAGAVSPRVLCKRCTLWYLCARLFKSSFLYVWLGELLARVPVWVRLSRLYKPLLARVPAGSLSSDGTDRQRQRNYTQSNATQRFGGASACLFHAGPKIPRRHRLICAHVVRIPAPIWARPSGAHEGMEWNTSFCSDMTHRAHRARPRRACWVQRLTSDQEAQKCLDSETHGALARMAPVGSAEYSSTALPRHSSSAAPDGSSGGMSMHRVSWSGPKPGPVHSTTQIYAPVTAVNRWRANSRYAACDRRARLGRDWV